MSKTRAMRRSGVLAMVVALSACAETGDFGRPSPGFYHRSIAPLAGSMAALARGEPASFSIMTDEETELRHRAYRFLMPAAGGLILGHDEAAYLTALRQRADQSPYARYRATREDAENDRLLLGPFAALACRVREMDRIRLAALERMRYVSEMTRLMAGNRVAENEDLVSGVRDRLDRRLQSYRFALHHIAVETPDRAAAVVERALTALAAARAGLDRCPADQAMVDQGGEGPRDRVHLSAPGRSIGPQEMRPRVRSVRSSAAPAPAPSVRVPAPARGS
jgi:hypothetical protein